MTTMNISLPNSLKKYVDTLVQTKGYAASSEYIRELIQQDQEKCRVKEHLLIGIRYRIERAIDASFFASLRQRVATRRRP